MADEEKIPQTFLEKLLFYTTATFILLAIFSLFAFLFLVPFVIDPAFTTIFMQFDTNPAQCVTAETLHREGATNCSWASCREGCTKDIYDCLQIRVHYKRAPGSGPLPPPLVRSARALREYDYGEASPESQSFAYEDNEIPQSISDPDYPEGPPPTGLMGNGSEWFFTYARLFPNVKGCGYPPILNCTIFLGKYKTVGTNFTCYYSKVDPGLVISDLDMWQNTLNLVYAMAIPIPSFIVSVIYLTVAYFKIYNEDEEAAPLERNAEGMAGGEEGEGEAGEGEGVGATGGDTPGSDTFREDLASFGHQLKADAVGGSRQSCCSRTQSQSQSQEEAAGSRCSLDAGNVSNSGSIPG